MDQTFPTNDRRSRAVDRILNSRGGLPQARVASAPEVNDVEKHRSFVISGGKPQMAFSIVLESGEMHGFQYFNIDDLKFAPANSGQFLTFHHRGKVVVIKGRNLEPVFNGLIQHTLVALYEGGNDGAAPEMADTVIERLEVTNLKY